jgi:CRISPR/Cas system-associated exonuclease Cas4 (RecB family)
MNFSYTRLDLFSSCPFAYKQKYIVKAAEIRSEALDTGSIAHAAIDRYLKHLIETGQQTDITAMADIVHGVFYGGEEHGLGSSEYQEVFDICQLFADRFILNPDTAYGPEEWFEHKIGPDLMRGKIDWLEMDGNAAVVTDWKSDRAIRSQSDVDSDFQLKVYAWGLWRMFPHIEEIIVRLNFIRYFVPRETVIYSDEMPQIEKQITSQIEQIKAEKEFKATPGKFCQWCPYTEACPLVISNLISCQNADDAERLFGEILMMQRKIDERKEALKAYTNKNGVIELNGMIIGYTPSTSNSIKDVKAFIDASERNDIKWMDYVNIDGRKIKKLERHEVIGELFEETTTTKFQVKKAKGEE